MSPGRFPQHRIRLWLVVLLAAWAAPAPARLPAEGARLHFKLFRDQDGLPQNSAQILSVDRDGRVWVGTQDGAAVYNGRSWRIVDLPSKKITNSVRVVLRASNGDLWFGCDGAVNRLRGDEWTVFTRNDGIPEGWTRALVEAPGPGGAPEIWIGTDTGLGRFDGAAWTDVSRATPIENTPVRSLLVDDGTLLVGTETKGLWSLAAPVRGAPVRDASYGATTAFCLARVAKDAESTGVIAGTETGLLERTSGGWTPISLGPGVEANVRCVLETTSAKGERVLWAGTYGDGLFVREHGAWTRYTTTTGLPHDKIDCLLASTNADGVATTVWIGTDAGGVARAELGRWRELAGPVEAPDPVVLAIRETDSFLGRPEMWVGTYGSGLLRYADGAWQTSGPLAPPKMSGAWALLESRSETGAPELWVGTDGDGIMRLSNGVWTRFDTAHGFPNGLVYCLLETRNARGGRVIWAGTGGSGLVRYEDGTWTTVGLSAGAPSLFIQSIAETVGADGARTLWVGTLGGGLGRFRDGRWTQFNTATGFPNDTVYSLSVFADSAGRPYVLIGTAGNGLLRFDPEPERPEFVAIAGGAADTPLPNDVVYTPLLDEVGRLYVPTNKGLARLTPRASGGYDAITYTVDDGLPSNECDLGTTVRDGSGRIWIGTVRGLAVFDPAEDVVARPASRILLEPTAVDDAKISGPDLGELSYKQVQITFEYAALASFREQDTRYRSQLVGLEDRPTEWTTDVKRQFTSLPPGSYTFRVWARDFMGTETAPAEIRFVVAPAPWLTWWAFGAYALAAGAIVFGGVRWRLSALERRNRELEQGIEERTGALAASERRARDANRAKSVFLANMSHELRTPLNAILGFLQLLDRDRDLSGKQREMLGIIGRSGEHLLSLINDVLSVSKIEAGQATLNRQILDLRRLLQGLEEMFRVRAESKALSFQFEVLDDVPQFVVGDENKLRQILINLLGNAFKFTDEGGVALTVSWRDGRCTFRVRDTGQGIGPNEMRDLFEPFVQTRSGERAREGTGLGLAISRNFARMMSGDIKVASEVGEGSTFTVEVELPKSEHGVVEREARRVEALAPGQAAYKILVVDDRWENRSLLVRLLQDVGFSVREAENGREAVAIWSEWRPALVWMDMRMPVMDGREATRRIRELAGTPGEPVIIALTASAFEQDRDEILASGCDDYVAKPFREHDVFDRMARHLGVAYVYDRPAETHANGDGERARVSPEELAALPTALLGALKEAAEIGDIRATLAVVGDVAAVDADLAARIAALVKAYDFESLQDALDAAGSC